MRYVHIVWMVPFYYWRRLRGDSHADAFDRVAEFVREGS